MRRWGAISGLIFLPLVLWAALPDQVMIEVKVVEIVRDYGKELGIRWGYDRGKHTLKPILGDHESTQSPAEERTGGGGPESALWQGEFDLLSPYFDRGVDLLFDRIRIGSTILDARLQALISQGKAELLANPKIVTINGKQATIVIGNEVPFQTTKLVSNQTVLTTEFKTAGVTLVVTPRIQEEDFILLEVEPQVSGITGHQDVVFGTVEKMKVASLPVFSTRKAKTSVLVKNGGTLVIGGLLQKNKVKEIQKVPLLGSIPILGLLFRHTKETTQNNELVIFITPHIIRPGEGTVIPQLMEESEGKK